MLHGSCVSERPACSRSAGGLAASGAVVGPTNFFGGAPPEFLKSIYKIPPDSDYLAKFQGDRSRDLGESVAKK